MKKNDLKKKSLIFCTAILVTGCFLVSGVWAAEVSKEIKAKVTIVDSTITLKNGNDLDFGSIAPKPGEAVSILLDASGGASTAASPHSGTATLSGTAKSGLIKVTSPVSCDLSIKYAVTSESGGGEADKVEQTVGGSKKLGLTSASVKRYSTSSPLAVVAGTEAEIHIGGLLEIPDDLTDGEFGKDYEGYVKVTVDYQ